MKVKFLIPGGFRQVTRGYVRKDDYILVKDDILEWKRADTADPNSFQIPHYYRLVSNRHIVIRRIKN